MTRVIVGGAGIGGLTATIALGQIGVDVTVLDRRAVLGELGAGIQLAPNATRILARLGILADLLPLATPLEAIRIRRARDGATLADLPLGRAAERRYGAPFLVIHRADLQKTLVQHLGRHGELKLGVTMIRANQVGASVAVETEGQGVETRTADGFVDASGIHASRRDGGSLRDSRRIAWRALVPAHAVPPDFARPETNLWLGPRTHLVHYPIRGGTCINIVAITEDDGARSPGDDVWSEPGDPQQLRRTFQGWQRDARALIEAAPAWHRWPLLDHSSSAPWSVGSMTRLGDAAHPMLPFLAQGASQAIEDAEALVSAIADAETVKLSFALFEARRRGRAQRVQRASRRQGDIYHLRRPASDIRDVAMGLLGGQRALASMDWLYAEKPDRPAS